MPAFHNLCFSKEFRDHNFSDFYADGDATGRIDRVPESYIERHLRRSFPPHPEGGLEPYFWHILPITISEEACRSYLRTQSLPVDEKDYYLSKLFQFLYAVLFTRYFQPDDYETATAQELFDLLATVPPDLLPPNERIDWDEFWWTCYADACELSLAQVLSRLAARLKSLIAQTVAPQGSLPGKNAQRRHGPPPDLATARAVAQAVSAFQGDWRCQEGLTTVCGDLDRRRIPISEAWHLWDEPPTSWISALQAHKERVVKALEHRLRQAGKYQDTQ